MTAPIATQRALHPRELGIEYSVVENDVTADFAQFARHSNVAADVETTGLDWRTHKLKCITLFVPTWGNDATFSYENSRAQIVRFTDEHGTSPRLAKILSSPGYAKIFHHAPFDLRFLLAQRDIDVWAEGSLWDTKLASKFLHTERTGLGYLLREQLGILVDKDQALSNWGADTLSDDQIRYALNDVIYLPRLMFAQTLLLSDANLLTEAERAMDFIPHVVRADVKYNVAKLFEH